MLERPLLSIPSAQVDNSSYEDLIKKHIIQVGYGMTGYFLAQYHIMDAEKRASYSYASSYLNQLQDLEEAVSSSASMDSDPIKFTVPAHRYPLERSNLYK